MKTAEDFLVSQLQKADPDDNCKEHLLQVLRDFADGHVREALEKASRAAKINLKTQSGESQCLAFGGSHGVSAHVDKHSITNAYPKSKYIL